MEGLGKPPQGQPRGGAASELRHNYHYLFERGILENLRIILAKGPREIARKLIKAIRVAVTAHFDRKFDERHGVDTAGHVAFVALDAQTEDEEGGFDYWPTPIQSFKALLARLPDDYRDYTFVDYGSGKGRTLLMAAELPFKRVLGVELAKSLSDVATDNIRAFRSDESICRDVESVCVDATKFPIPDGPCFFYFYCPFYADTLGQVLDKIKASYAADPRPMIIVYTNFATFEITFPYEMIENLGIFQRHESPRLPFDISPKCPLRVALYRTGS